MDKYQVLINNTQLMFMIRTNTNDSYFSNLVCAVLDPYQLLPCPKEAVADPPSNKCCSVLL